MSHCVCQNAGQLYTMYSQWC